MHSNSTNSPIDCHHPSRLDTKHLSEFIEKSGISRELLAVNEIYTASGNVAIEFYLQSANVERKNGGGLSDAERRKVSHLEPGGWIFESIDPFTEKTTGYGCIKPNEPRTDEKGKEIKYEAPLERETELLFPRVDKASRAAIARRYYAKDNETVLFWEFVRDTPSIPIVVAEGAKKLLCGVSHGFACVGVTGYTHLQKAISALEPFLHPDRRIIFAMDVDEDKKLFSQVHRQIQKASGILQEIDPDVRCVKVIWQNRDGKGLDDLIVNGGVEAFEKAIKRGKPVKAIDSETVEQEKKTRGQRLYDWFTSEFGERLRFNELTMDIEIDGKSQDMDDFHAVFLIKSDIKCSKDNFCSIARLYAKHHAYHPVKRYLEEVASTVSPISLDNLSRRYFGTLDPIYDEMLKLFLIAAVARIYEPGCKFDNALVLQGKQYAGKSSFFEVLFGREFFTDSVRGTAKDDLLIMHRYWCCELAEIETITGRKEVGELKQFLSTRIDTFREPYARTTKPRPRQGVLCGTVNPDVFLQDQTGNRRFWVIPVAIDSIPIATLRNERDSLWAEAVRLYRDKHQWEMSPESLKQVNELNEKYLHSDSWEPAIVDFLADRSQVTVSEVLEKAIRLELGRIGKREEMRAGNILKSLGWQRNTVRLGNTTRKVWEKPVTTYEVVTEGGNNQNPYGEGVVSTVTTVTTYSKNLKNTEKEEKEPTLPTACVESGRTNIIEDAYTTQDLSKDRKEVETVETVETNLAPQGFELVTTPVTTSETLKGGNTPKEVTFEGRTFKIGERWSAINPKSRETGIVEIEALLPKHAIVHPAEKPDIPVRVSYARLLARKEIA
jgi:predicted P-loop ATPase